MVRLFGHFIPFAFLLLALVEGGLLFLAVLLGHGLWAWLAPYHVDFTPLARLLDALLFCLVLSTMLVAMGLYERQFWRGRADMLLRVVAAFLLGLLSLGVLYYLFPGLRLGRGEFALTLVVGFGAIVAAKLGFLAFSNPKGYRRRVLVLGTGHRAGDVAAWLATLDTSPFEVVGYSPVDGPVQVPKDQVLAATNSLYDAVGRYQVDEVLVAVDDRRNDFPVEEILECKLRGVDVTDFLSFYERETGKIPLDALHPSGLAFANGFHQTPWQRIGKRMFDLGASVGLLLLAWPLMILTTAAIWLETGRPILYRQERVGRDGNTFRVIKFRSMRTDAEGDGVARWAAKNDSRITKVGHFIRQTRIDELPQLFNIIQGHMSFVGPRPERPSFVEQLAKGIPFYSMRHRVNPGLTGWAQICYPYGASDKDAREKLQYDLYYIKNFSLFLDCLVLLQTVHTVIWGRGAR